MVQTEVVNRGTESNTWTTMDIVVVAVLGVVFGVLNAPLGAIYALGMAAFGPIWTGIFMVFNISQIVAMYIIRKPGVALVNGTINGVVQFLSGNPSGVLAIFWGLLQGIGVELPFLFTKYRIYTWPVFFVGAGLATALAKIVNVIVYGWGSLSIPFLIMIWILSFFMSGIFSGLVGIGIAKLLQKTGLLRSFRGGIA